MKRVISLCLISAIFTSSVIPAFAQKSRQPRESKIKAQEAANRFGEVRAFSDGSGVLVKWEMAAETNNVGFYVYRIDQNGSRIVSPEMTMGSSSRYGAQRVSGEKYSFFDQNGDTQGAYYIKSVSIDGKALISDTVAPEQVADLRSVGAESSQDLNRQVSDTKTNRSITSNKLELPKALAAETGANNLIPDPVTQKWVVAQPGVKISIRKEGLYRVTRSELQTGGFNVNVDSNFWQLYVDGVEQAVIIGPGANYIEFYGKGIDTPESDTRIYYLVSGPVAGKRIDSRLVRPVTGTVTSPNYSQTFLQKERINYINQILNGDAENYWGQAITAFADTTFNLSLSGVDFTVPNANLALSFQGYSFDTQIISVVFNGQTLASVTGSSRSAFSKQYVIPTSFLREGANSIVFHSQSTTSTTLFDSVSIGFARKQLASQNRLSSYTQNYRISKLDGFSSSNVRVFDTTSESSPVMLTNLNIAQNGATYTVTMPADRGRLMFAVEDSGLLQAAAITPNDPTILGVPTNAANLVIISYKDWLPQAENWANYRRGQGFTVKVVEVSEIYDEFNYGTISADAIKSFLQYAENNWQVAPGYVLLLGDASYDGRNYEGNGFLNYVPSRIVNTVFTETGSDDYLADFNNDGLAEMAVGRIPARNAQAVTDALAKVTAFEQAAPTLGSRGVLFAFDQFDFTNNYDFRQISTNLRNQLPPSTPATMIGRDDTPASPDTPHTLLISSMNTGKYIINYSGHGTSGAWFGTSFFSNFDVPLLSNANNQSIYTMLTCLNGYFLQTTRVSLAETLLQANNGGAVAAWASTGETTPDVQEIMATRFYLKLGQRTIPRLGDLINDAKTVIPGGTDVRLSWALLGDPMLKIAAPVSGDRQEFQQKRLR